MLNIHFLQYSDLQRDNSEATTYQCYPDWKLSSISIYLKNQRPDTAYVVPYTRNELETMAHLVVLIPSIKWLKGRGQKSMFSKPYVPTKLKKPCRCKQSIGQPKARVNQAVPCCNIIVTFIAHASLSSSTPHHIPSASSASY